MSAILQITRNENEQDIVSSINTYLRSGIKQNGKQDNQTSNKYSSSVSKLLET